MVDTSFVGDISKFLTSSIQTNMILIISLVFLGYIVYLLWNHWDAYKDYIDGIK